jgi:hypothetical protein
MIKIDLNSTELTLHEQNLQEYLNLNIDKEISIIMKTFECIKNKLNKCESIPSPSEIISNSNDFTDQIDLQSSSIDQKIILIDAKLENLLKIIKQIKLENTSHIKKIIYIENLIINYTQNQVRILSKLNQNQNNTCTINNNYTKYIGYGLGFCCVVLISLKLIKKSN